MKLRLPQVPSGLALRLIVVAAAVLLQSCGGGNSPDSKPAEASDEQRVRALAVSPNDPWVTLPTIADPLLQNLAIPADAPTRGMWSGTKAWPLNAIHAIVLSDGRLLTFGTPFNNAGAQDGRFYDVWSPSLGFAAGSHIGSVVPDPVNSFCGTSTWLGDGRLLVSGGNGGGGKSSGLFSTTTSTATADNFQLAAERWYATMLSLPDGRSLILGGTVPYASPVTSQTPEIYEGGRWRSLMGASSTPIFGVRDLEGRAEANPWYYPRAWVAPDGAVFGITSNIMFKLRPDDNGGSGSITRVGTFKTPQDVSSNTRPNVGFTSAAVMYEPGRILQVGGNGITDNNPNQASALATIIDINGGTPVLTETAAMSNRRHWANATVLPGGQVLVTGGTTVGWDPANAVRAAEIWNPQTGQWTLGAGNTETRTYHSTALLLPNGTVFTGGGGAPGAVNNQNADVYYPPQLFTSVNGVAQFAKRPVLQGISSLKAAHGGELGLKLSDNTALSQVSLVALGSVTHSFNNTQRRIPLVFSQAANIVSATLPASANVAPPGYYMLFAVDQAGVPSRGTIIALGNLPAPAINGVSATPANAVACANEGGNCNLPAGQKASVYYGAGSSFVVRTGLGGAVACNNDTFGDPVPGVGKSCSYVLESAPVVAPVVNAPPVIAGAQASYNVTAAAGSTYSWNFGDGSAATAFSNTAATTHVYANPGVYNATLTVRAADGSLAARNFLQAVGTAATPGKPVASSATALETRGAASARLWVANPDADTVAVIDTASNARVAEITVGVSPRSVAVAPDGRLWVSNKGSSSVSIISPATLTVVATVNLPPASQPHGLVFAPGGSAFVVLEATGQLLKLNAANGASEATLAVGNNPRQLSATADGATVLVSRFITNPLPGEGSAVVDTANAGGEVLAVNAAAMVVNKTIVLRHSDKVDSEAQGSGIPNYLGAAVLAPDGRSAWVPSKQDNIKRGQLRKGLGLDFQNTVRAISSRIDMTTLAEDYARRVDHDNASLGSAAVYHPSGAYLFVALETSRQVALMDAAGGRELARYDVGRAPQALSLSADGSRLYVQNFMDRTVSVLDLNPLVTQGQPGVATLATVGTVGNEKLGAQVLLGKQLFYDARDPRLARDSYMSCASCHSDAGHDGRTWDFTGFGEGLRNTPALKGRAGMAQGFAHWSANFDEIQDFEGQIRNFAGGTGLMDNAQFNTGTRNTPLGDRKAGVSADLDALAAYLASLGSFDNSPYRNADGTLTAAATAGKAVFTSANCASCHGGAGFALGGDAGALKNVGTLKPASGQRLGAALNGLDVPTLRDAWKTGPYLHDGSAATLAAAVQAHAGNTVAGADLANLSAYLQQIGAQEDVAPGTPVVVAGSGTGLAASYFNNATLTGAAVLSRVEAPWFDWGVGAPAASVPADNFSVRWTGFVQATAGGNYQFRTNSDDGVRVWVNGVQLINNWTAHAPTLDTSGNVALTAGQRVPIVVEFQEFGGGALLQLSWLPPGGSWVAVPVAQLSARADSISPLPPAAAVACGNEGGNCTLPAGASATVWFGANGSWFLRTGVAGGIACNVATFGDPIVGTVKACRYQVSTAAPAPNVAPTVALTAPATGTSVAQGTAVSLAATAADSDGSVARVEFYDGAALLGTDSAAPFAISWTGAAVGTHNLTAKAYDNTGASTTSAVVVLTVLAPAVNGLPVAAWAFNEGSGAAAADSSGGNRPLALSNTTWVAGRSGQAAQFNGASSSGSTSGPVLNTAQSFSVATWVRLDALNEWRTFVNQDGVNVSGFWLQYSQWVGNKFALTMHDADSTSSGAYRAVGTTTPVVGQWYHVVGVRDKAAGLMKLYVNGKLEGTTAYGGGWAANGSLNVGRGKWGGPGDWFGGALDEVKAYTTALSDADVAQLYAQYTVPVAAVNLAPSAVLATSYVSPWEQLAAVNNGITPTSSADKNGGAYGNWQGDTLYGRTDWVSFSWSTAKSVSAFEVYWWNDGQGIATPGTARVEYWNGSAWVALGAPGLALNTFNRLNFAAISTTSIRVSMSSARATGILEARVLGN